MRGFFFIITVVSLLLEFYNYQAFRTLFSQYWQRMFYWAINIATYLFSFYLLLTLKGTPYNQMKTQLIISIFLGFIFPKALVTIFLAVDDLIRSLTCFFHFPSSAKENHYPERRKFLRLIGIGIAGIFSLLVVDGIIFGKYRYHVRKISLKLKDLPRTFRGYRIVQISDVHSGSFFHPERIQKAIDIINQQEPDLVLFTGDMVNYLAKEFVPFVSLFARIKAKDGKYSVLGNHDYGSYALSTEKEQQQNIQELIALEKKAGFVCLRNEHIAIEKKGEKLYIIGVENWGIPPLPQYGNLDKAIENIPEKATKILMSHDPTHFDHVVKNHPEYIALTLSGHTHGMQFGIDLKHHKWSPVKYKYPKWIDLYKSKNRYLYVNRGFGVIGYPGRVGINPEITLFELS
ncbi:MAG: metallophosphoesterase [Bergeyella sp.]|nr:metallophosphoesterase [Bergeyella sp.]